MSFVWRKRWFLLLLPLLLAVTVWQIRVESDLNAFFTNTDNPDTKLLSGLLQSGELSRRYLLVVEKADPNAAPAIAAFSAKLIQQLATLQDVEQVWPANQPPRDWITAIQFYAPYHARIFSLNPDQDANTLFNPDSLPRRAEGLKQALFSPQGSFIKVIAKQDPLLLSLTGFKTLQAQFHALKEDGGALILQSHPAALDSAAHELLQTAIRSSFDNLNQAAGHVYRLSMAGVPVFSVAARSEISHDVTLVSTVSSVSVVLVFLVLFRSFAALHWLMLLQAAAFVVGTLATALIFHQVHSLTLALGASLIGICVDYPLHVMVHSAKHRSSLQTNVRLLWPSLFMGGLTTVIGYAAMGLTGFPGFEQIAIFALFSIATSLALTRWILPALLENTTLQVAHLPGISNWADFCGRRRKPILSVLALTAVVAIFFLPQLRWMDDMQKLAMNMDELKQQDQTVRSHFSSIEPGRFVLIQADDFETALQRAEAAERRLQSLKQSGVVSDYHGLFPWLSSQALQNQNARVYNAALTPRFQDAWRVALSDAGLSTDKLGTLLPAAKNGLFPKAVLDTPVRHVLSGQLLAEQQGVALALWLGDHDPVKLIAGLQGLEGTRYFSQREQLNQLAGQYRDRSLRMLAIGIAVMGCLIWLQQRSLKQMLLTLTPSLTAVLFIFAAWALLGEELSFLHVIGLLLSISLCVDYGIFFMENRGQDRNITYHAIAASTLTTLASFGALGLGKTPTLPILAMSVSLGVSLGFLLCPLLLPKQIQP